ncbi:MAG: putative membrane protein YphA (DoxX/SURF4 family) [Paracoccaceae bacterium]|jgi:uncharacterized membrane protein YphA (DoxX/SURF4 family)
MNNDTANHVTISAMAQNLLRILIASYFLAVALQIIPGTDLTILTGIIAPDQTSEALAAMIVFGLSYLVMIGVWMRGAALLLGVMTFFASYLTMLELGLEDELGSFWRDLALIAALMLTYSDNEPRGHRLQTIMRKRIIPRRVMPSGLASAVPQPAALIPSSVVAAASNYKRQPVNIEEIENIFMAELAHVRSNQS